MKIEGISELDLNGILFVHFADDTPLDECRDRLELLAYEAWEEDCKGLEEDEKPVLELSPYWIFRALCRKNRNEWRTMDKKEQKEWIEYSMNERNERIREVLKKREIVK